MWDTWRKSVDEGAFKGTALAPRCYESHPVLKLGKGTLYGGNARMPKVKDADIYVCLQSGDMTGKQSDPWDAQQVIEVQYAIQDMRAPENVTRFKNLITWLCTQLQEGKAVHVGCIGGHGRTGMVLSAVVAELAGKKDAIGWVRKHYCKKAVESKAQVAFLQKHYRVAAAEPAKGEVKQWEGTKGRPTDADTVWLSHSPGVIEKRSASSYPAKPRRVEPEGLTTSTKSYSPMASARSLWKAKR